MSTTDSGDEVAGLCAELRERGRPEDGWTAEEQAFYERVATALTRTHAALTAAEKERDEAQITTLQRVVEAADAMASALDGSDGEGDEQISAYWRERAKLNAPKA